MTVRANQESLEQGFKFFVSLKKYFSFMLTIRGITRFYRLTVLKLLPSELRNKTLICKLQPSICNIFDREKVNLKTFLKEFQ